MSKDLIIVQARLASTRLPGKVLMKMAHGKSLLDIQIELLNDANLPFVIATSDNPADDAIEEFCLQKNVSLFRGDEHNVLNRFIECAKERNAEHLIRVCSDNPFLQLGQIPHYVTMLNEGYDYVSYCNVSGRPAIKTHWGLYVEGVRLQALEKAQQLLTTHPQQAFYSEHVTNFIYGNPQEFRVALEEAPDYLSSRNDLRFTIDTLNDFRNIESVLALISDIKPLTLKKLIEVVDQHQEIKSTMLEGIKSFDK